MIAIIYIICISSIFCQTSSSSMYGFGEYVNSFDASSSSLGDSKFFGEYNNRIIFSSPSSYWKSSFSNLFMSASANFNEFAGSDLVENNFKMFSFTFPIGDSKMCAFGMNPLIRSEFNLSEETYSTIGADESPTGNPIAFLTDYSFSGGISEIFLLYSSSITNNISFGFKWSKLFGTSKNKYYLKLYDLTFDEDLNPTYTLTSGDLFVDNNKYSSNKYLLELRFEYGKISTVLSHSQSKPLSIEHTPYYCGGLSDSDCENYYNVYDQLIKTEHYTSNNRLLENGIGFNYEVNKQIGVIFEHHNLDSFNSYEFLNIFNTQNPDIQSDHLGFYYKYNNDINSVINQSIIKFGLFNKTNKFNHTKIYDRGLTVGFGMNYFNNKNFIDFAFKVGYKSTEYNNLEDEKYYSIMITLLGGEKWFLNERNK